MDFVFLPKCSGKYKIVLLFLLSCRRYDFLKEQNKNS